MKSFIKYGFLFTTIACATVGLTLYLINSGKESPAKNEVYALVVKEADNGWQYEIHYNDQPIIKQEFIPAVSGNRPFANKKDAKTIGALVLHKIKNGVVPPTVSIADINTNKIVLTPF